MRPTAIWSSFRSRARVAPAQLAAALLILYPYRLPPVLPSPIEPILLDITTTCKSSVCKEQGARQEMLCAVQESSPVNLAEYQDLSLWPDQSKQVWPLMM